MPNEFARQRRIIQAAEEATVHVKSSLETGSILNCQKIPLVDRLLFWGAYA